MKHDVEILIYDKKKKCDIEIVRDVYTIKEMIKFMKNKSHCLFEIETYDSVFVYDENIMEQLKKNYKHCFFFDRKVMMIK